MIEGGVEVCGEGVVGMRVNCDVMSGWCCIFRSAYFGIS